jgi:serine/threonine-protein kinase
MTGDPPLSWDALSAELDALLDLDPGARAARLDIISADDPTRATALRNWLRAIADSHSFLESPIPAAPSGLGPWRALERIGEGGMGEVWRGERGDGAFERNVAIKFLRVDRGAAAASITRERAMLARLRHPGIAQLLDGGVADDGRPWLVTEWIEGLRLDDWLGQRQPNLRQRVELIRRLAESVAYAHANLVVHRDLKPANVLVDTEGSPRLLDFGIARLLDGGVAAPATIDQALTPAWASPEQLRGEPADARTDVHALGGLLFLALVGRSPHGVEGGSLAAVVDAVCNHDPPPPSRLAPHAGIDADLDAITLLALARQREQRYGSADALAADLGRWLAGEVVRARLPSRIERLARGVRRHPLEATLLGGLLLTLGAGVAATAWQAREADRARQAALVERDAALAELDRSEYLVDTFARLFRESSTDTPRSASEWLDRAATIGNEVGPENAAAQARFLVKLAGIEQDRGQPARSIRLLRRALAAPDGALAAADRARAECRLAGALLVTGDLQTARTVYSDGIGRAEGLAGSERAILIDCLNSRANFALTEGAADPAAFAAANRALAELDRLSTPEDQRWRRASVLYTLAALHDLDGADAEAATRYAEVLRIDQELGNTASADHAALLTAMAGALQRAGDWEAADRRYVEGIAIYEGLGDLHPNLASDLANHAGLLNLRGDFDAALVAAGRALDILDRLSGAQPIARGNAMYHRGVALRELGQVELALESLEATRDLLVDQVPTSPRVMRVHIALALAALAGGDTPHARGLIDQAVVAARMSGSEAMLAEALIASARIAQAAGQSEAARSGADEARAILARQLPPDHPLRRRGEKQIEEIDRDRAKSG